MRIVKRLLKSYLTGYAKLYAPLIKYGIPPTF